MALGAPKSCQDSGQSPVGLETGGGTEALIRGLHKTCESGHRKPQPHVRTDLMAWAGVTTNIKYLVPSNFYKVFMVPDNIRLILGLWGSCPDNEGKEAGQHRVLG